MSPTPPDEAGALTEAIMAEWLRRLTSKGVSRPDVAVYNAAYEAVYLTLSKRAAP
jgi:hypothetical protein